MRTAKSYTALMLVAVVMATPADGQETVSAKGQEAGKTHSGHDEVKDASDECPCDTARAESETYGVPCTCPIWPIYTLAPGWDLYYAERHPNSTCFDNYQAVYVEGYFPAWPYTCEDCIDDGQYGKVPLTARDRSYERRAVYRHRPLAVARLKNLLIGPDSRSGVKWKLIDGGSLESPVIRKVKFSDTDVRNMVRIRVRINTSEMGRKGRPVLRDLYTAIEVKGTPAEEPPVLTVTLPKTSSQNPHFRWGSMDDDNYVFLCRVANRPAVQVTPSLTIKEGEEKEVKIELTANAPYDTHVHYVVEARATGADADDYELLDEGGNELSYTSGSVTIPKGEKEFVITVKATDDDDPADQEFRIRLVANPGLYRLRTNNRACVVTIEDD